MKYATAVGYYFFESMKNTFSVMYVAEKIFRNFVGENFLNKVYMLFISRNQS